MATSPGTFAAYRARRVLYHSWKSASRSGAMVALTTKSAGFATVSASDLVRVLARRGWRAADARARAVEGQGQRYQLVVISRHGLDHADGLRLRLRHCLWQRVDRTAGHARRLQEIDPLPFGAREQDALDLRKQLRLVVDAGGVGGESRIRRPLGMPQHLGKLCEEAIVAGGDDERPRLGLEALEGHDAVAARPVPLRHFAGRAEAREVALEPCEAGLEERGVDDAATTRLLALDQPGQRADGRPHTRAVVEHGGADPRGWPAVVAVHHHEPGEGLHHGLVAGLELERARAAEGPYRAVDEPREALGERLGAEPHLLEGAGTEVLNEDVGAPDQLQQPLDVGGLLEIEGDAALVRVDGEEARRDALPEGRAPAARVVTLGPLDLDDVGAHVAEDLRGDGAGQILRDLDDGDAVEREHVLNLHEGALPSPYPLLRGERGPLPPSPRRGRGQGEGACSTATSGTARARRRRARRHRDRASSPNRARRRTRHATTRAAASRSAACARR